MDIVDQLGQADIPGILQLLGAGSIGGLVADWLLKRRERRESRARVQDAVGLVWESMWADHNRDLGDQWRDLLRALRALKSAALVAGLPQSHVEFQAQVVLGHWAILRSRVEEDRYDPEVGASIPREVSEAYRIATKALVIRLWRPWLGRLRPSSWRRHVKKRVNAIAEEIRPDDDQRTFKWRLENEPP